jgi:hypothetical protein
MSIRVSKLKSKDNRESTMIAENQGIGILRASQFKIPARNSSLKNILSPKSKNLMSNVKNLQSSIGFRNTSNSNFNASNGKFPVVRFEQSPALNPSRLANHGSVSSPNLFESIDIKSCDHAKPGFQKHLETGGLGASSPHTTKSQQKDFKVQIISHNMRIEPTLAVQPMKINLLKSYLARIQTQTNNQAHGSKRVSPPFLKSTWTSRLAPKTQTNDDFHLIRNESALQTTNKNTNSQNQNFFVLQNKFNLKNFLYKIMTVPKKIERKQKTPKFKPKRSNLFPAASLWTILTMPHLSILKVAEFPTMALVDVPKGQFLLIFGGLSSYIHNEFLLYDVNNQTAELKYESKNGQNARFGHSMDVIKDKAYIFGGTNSFQNEANIYSLVNYNHLDFLFFALDMSNWTTRDIRNPLLASPAIRKFHTSFVFEETYIFIIGGIWNGDKFLKDIWVFDTEEETWNEFSLVQDLGNSGIERGVYHHKMICMSSAITSLRIENPKSTREKDLEAANTTKRLIGTLRSDKKHIALDVYLFGGINRKNALIGNELWQLYMKNHNFYFKKVDVMEGPKPAQRHSHTMNKLNANELIVYGGKDENNYLLTSMCIFNFGNRQWRENNLINSEWIGGISSHSAEVCGNIFFIFGGIQISGFIKPHIYYSALC